MRSPETARLRKLRRWLRIDQAGVNAGRDRLRQRNLPEDLRFDRREPQLVVQARHAVTDRQRAHCPQPQQVHCHLHRRDPVPHPGPGRVRQRQQLRAERGIGPNDPRNNPPAPRPNPGPVPQTSWRPPPSSAGRPATRCVLQLCLQCGGIPERDGRLLRHVVLVGPWTAQTRGTGPSHNAPGAALPALRRARSSLPLHRPCTNAHSVVPVLTPHPRSADQGFPGNPAVPAREAHGIMRSRGQFRTRLVRVSCPLYA